MKGLCVHGPFLSQFQPVLKIECEGRYLNVHKAHATGLSSEAAQPWVGLWEGWCWVLDWIPQLFRAEANPAATVPTHHCSLHPQTHRVSSFSLKDMT